MNLLDRFLVKTDFDSYEDFKANLKFKIPENFNFAYDVVDEYARLTPEKTAMVWCNDSGKEKVISFSEMKTYTDKTANVFIKHGIKKGDFVMLMLMTRYEFWYVLLALHKIGAIAIPATHQLTAKDIKYRCDAADIKAIICINKPDVIEYVRNAKQASSNLEKIFCLGENEDFINFYEEFDSASAALGLKKPTKNTDPLLMYFTSGTTGLPKMVVHNHLYPLAHIVTGKYWHNIDDDCLHFTSADTGWAKASWGKIYGQWIAGGVIFTYDYLGKFFALDLLPLLEKYGVDTFCAPPTVYRYLIKEDLVKYKFNKMKYFTTAGEPLNPEVLKQFESKTTHKIFEGFGQSETAILLGTFIWMEPKPGSMGKPNPLYDISLIDDDGNEVGLMEEGEMVIKMTSDIIGITSGYYKDPEKTAALFENGFFHTGDLAYKDGDGYYWFIGRKDDIIKSSGYRIGPFEVESALMEHPSVLDRKSTRLNSSHT